MAEFKSTIILKGVTSDLDRKLKGVKSKMDGISGNVKTANSRFKRMNSVGVKTFRDMDKGAKKLNDSTSKLNKTIEKTTSKMKMLGAAAVAALSVQALNSIMKFEKGMSAVQSVLDITRREMVGLTAEAKRLGQTTVFTAGQASGAMEKLAMAGFNAAQTLAATSDTLNLAAAGSLDLARAADISSNVLKGFGMQVKELARVADVMARAAARSNTTVEELGLALSYVGPVAKQSGLSLEETVAAIGKLSDAGIKGTRAGMAMRQMLIRLQAPPAAAATKLKELGVVTRNIEGDFKGLSEVLLEVGKATNDAGDFADIFGRVASSGAGVLSEASKDNSLLILTDTLNNAEGAAKRMASVRLDNLAGDVTLMTSAWDGLTQSIMSAGITDFLRSMAQTMTDGIRSMTFAIERFIFDSHRIISMPLPEKGYLGFFRAIRDVLSTGILSIDHFGVRLDLVQTAKDIFEGLKKAFASAARGAVIFADAFMNMLDIMNYGPAYTFQLVRRGLRNLAADFAVFLLDIRFDAVLLDVLANFRKFFGDLSDLFLNYLRQSVLRRGASFIGSGGFWAPIYNSVRVKFNKLESMVIGTFTQKIPSMINEWWASVWHTGISMFFLEAWGKKIGSGFQRTIVEMLLAMNQSLDDIKPFLREFSKFVFLGISKATSIEKMAPQLSHGFKLLTKTIYDGFRLVFGAFMSPETAEEMHKFLMSPLISVDEAFRKLGRLLKKIASILKKQMKSLINIIFNTDFIKVKIKGFFGDVLDSVDTSFTEELMTKIFGGGTDKAGSKATDDIFSGIRKAIKKNVNAVKKAFKPFKKFFKSDLMLAIGDLSVTIGKVFSELAEIFLEVSERIYVGVVTWFMKLYDKLVGHSIVPDLVRDILKVWTALEKSFIAVVSRIDQKTVDRFQKMYDALAYSTKVISTKFVFAWVNMATLMRVQVFFMADAIGRYHKKAGKAFGHLDEVIVTHKMQIQSLSKRWLILSKAFMPLGLILNARGVKQWALEMKDAIQIFDKRAILKGVLTPADIQMGSFINLARSIGETVLEIVTADTEKAVSKVKTLLPETKKAIEKMVKSLEKLVESNMPLSIFNTVTNWGSSFATAIGSWFLNIDSDSILSTFMSIFFKAKTASLIFSAISGVFSMIGGAMRDKIKDVVGKYFSAKWLAFKKSSRPFFRNAKMYMLDKWTSVLDAVGRAVNRLYARLFEWSSDPRVFERMSRMFSDGILSDMSIMRMKVRLRRLKRSIASTLSDISKMQIWTTLRERFSSIGSSMAGGFRGKGSKKLLKGLTAIAAGATAAALAFTTLQDEMRPMFEKIGLEDTIFNVDNVVKASQITMVVLPLILAITWAWKKASKTLEKGIGLAIKDMFKNAFNVAFTWLRAKVPQLFGYIFEKLWQGVAYVGAQTWAAYRPIFMAIGAFLGGLSSTTLMIAGAIASIVFVFVKWETIMKNIHAVIDYVSKKWAAFVMIMVAQEDIWAAIMPNLHELVFDKEDTTFGQLADAYIKDLKGFYSRLHGVMTESLGESRLRELKFRHREEFAELSKFMKKQEGEITKLSDFTNKDKFGMVSKSGILDNTIASIGEVNEKLILDALDAKLTNIETQFEDRVGESTLSRNLGDRLKKIYNNVFNYIDPMAIKARWEIKLFNWESATLHETQLKQLRDQFKELKVDVKDAANAFKDGKITAEQFAKQMAKLQAQKAVLFQKAGPETDWWSKMFGGDIFDEMNDSLKKYYAELERLKKEYLHHKISLGEYRGALRGILLETSAQARGNELVSKTLMEQLFLQDEYREVGETINDALKSRNTLHAEGNATTEADYILLGLYNKQLEITNELFKNLLPSMANVLNFDRLSLTQEKMKIKQMRIGLMDQKKSQTMIFEIMQKLRGVSLEEIALLQQKIHLTGILRDSNKISAKEYKELVKAMKEEVLPSAKMDPGKDIRNFFQQNQPDTSELLTHAAKESAVLQKVTVLLKERLTGFAEQKAQIMREHHLDWMKEIEEAGKQTEKDLEMLFKGRDHALAKLEKEEKSRLKALADNISDYVKKLARTIDDAIVKAMPKSREGDLATALNDKNRAVEQEREQLKVATEGVNWVQHKEAHNAFKKWQFVNEIAYLAKVDKINKDWDLKGIKTARGQLKKHYALKVQMADKFGKTVAGLQLKQEGERLDRAMAMKEALKGTDDTKTIDWIKKMYTQTEKLKTVTDGAALSVLKFGQKIKGLDFIAKYAGDTLAGAKARMAKDLAQIEQDFAAMANMAGEYGIDAVTMEKLKQKAVQDAVIKGNMEILKLSDKAQDGLVHGFQRFWNDMKTTAELFSDATYDSLNETRDFIKEMVKGKAGLEEFQAWNTKIFENFQDAMIDDMINNFMRDMGLDEMFGVGKRDGQSMKTALFVKSGEGLGMNENEDQQGNKKKEPEEGSFSKWWQDEMSEANDSWEFGDRDSSTLDNFNTEQKAMWEQGIALQEQNNTDFGEMLDGKWNDFAGILTNGWDNLGNMFSTLFSGFGGGGNSGGGLFGGFGGFGDMGGGSGGFDGDSWFSGLFGGDGGISAGGAGELVGGFDMGGTGSMFAASGGYVSGSGSGTSDSIPAMLSNGEFVINSGATAKFGSLLSSINSGSFSGYADGGSVGVSRNVVMSSTNAAGEAAPMGLANVKVGLGGMAGIGGLGAAVSGGSQSDEDPDGPLAYLRLLIKKQREATAVSAAESANRDAVLGKEGKSGVDIVSTAANDKASAVEDGEKKANSARKKSNAAQKALGIVGAVMATAGAVAKALNTDPFLPMGPIMAGIAAAMGAVQIATIASANTGGFIEDGKVLDKIAGGRVHGPGSGTSDSVPAMLSNGEFVINARATQKHGALLEAINSGAVVPPSRQGFAGGGLVGHNETSDTISPADGFGSDNSNVSNYNTTHINIEGNVDQRAIDQIREVINASPSQVHASSTIGKRAVSGFRKIKNT